MAQPPEMPPLDATVWRLIPAGGDPLAPAPSQEGRFHHDGQRAVYTSLTREGCGVAIRRYLRADDGPRVIVPLHLRAERIADLRGAGAAPSIVWQGIRAGGAPSPTWRLSDAARVAGAQGMLYASRTRPDLTHLVLFGLNGPGEACAEAGPPAPWHAQSG